MLSNLFQLAAFGVADAATWRFAGSNAGLVVAAAVLFILGLATEGVTIDVAGLVARSTGRISDAAARRSKALSNDEDIAP